MLAVTASAQLSYSTKTATGATASEVIFPAADGQQIRVVGAIGDADKAVSALSFRTGTGAYVVSSSNTTSVTITLSQTNGIAINDLLLLQTVDGTCTYLGAVTNRSASTNLLASVAVTTVPGDQVFKLGSATALPVGAKGTNYTTSFNLQGQALYVGNRGRPLRVTLDSATTNTISSIVAAYE